MHEYIYIYIYIYINIHTYIYIYIYISFRCEVGPMQIESGPVQPSCFDQGRVTKHGTLWSFWHLDIRQSWEWVAVITADYVKFRSLTYPNQVSFRIHQTQISQVLFPLRWTVAAMCSATHVNRSWAATLTHPFRDTFWPTHAHHIHSPRSTLVDSSVRTDDDHHEDCSWKFWWMKVLIKDGSCMALDYPLSAA